MVSVRSALADTPKTAVAVALFVPTDVVKEPDGMVFVNVPETELVTMTVNVHDALGAIKVPCASVTVPSPTVAVAVPGLQLVEALDPKLTNPAGYTSVKGADKVADTKACVLVIVIVSRVVPPPEMLVGEKFLETSGLEGVTKSLSAAEHAPLMQEVAVFVFVTLAGGEITAVLVICVCPSAKDAPKIKKQATAAFENSFRTRKINCSKEVKKQLALQDHTLLT